MTAEISVMNKLAVALAADSASTINGGQKIYNSANKVFMLSKYHPIGIMVYGNAELLGVPWETIIKSYRERLADHMFGTVKQYMDNFAEFLTDNIILFPEAEQESYFLELIEFLHLPFIRENLDKELKNTGLPEIPKRRQIAQATKRIITTIHGQMNNLDNLDTFSSDDFRNCMAKYEAKMTEVINRVFNNYAITADTMHLLKEMCIMLYTKDLFTNGYSGVVIAGFGEEEVYPALKSIMIDGVLGNRLKMKRDMEEQITNSNAASIIPFAQQEMVANFMNGISTSILNALIDYLSTVFTDLPSLLIGMPEINGLPKDKKDIIKEKLTEASGNYVNTIFGHIEDQMRENFGPILASVSMLPKDELAAAAEALVNLTSFKRRVSMEAETVGGPIDVAVISKGDGFIWIKRKHYFKPELNQHFIKNYYRNCERGMNHE